MVDRLLDELTTPAHDGEPEPRRPTEIWPLISHHTYGGRSLFSADAVLPIQPRVLALLLAHDGLVAADPLQDVRLLAEQNRPDAAIATLARVISDIATVEPLIAGGALRFTATRPKLTDEARATVLDFFGVDPQMTAFTRLLEAAGAAGDIPGVYEREYAPQVDELFARFGLRRPGHTTTDEAAAAVRELAAAIIEVSWQFAVAASDPSCDIALVEGIELTLAEALMDDAAGTESTQAGRMLGATRHFARLDVGELPNLSVAQLAASDAMALRRDDYFEGFRDELRQALDELDTAARAGTAAYLSQTVFEERMNAACRRLVEQARKSTFRDRLREASIPTAIGIASSSTLDAYGHVAAGGGMALTALASVVWQWLSVRRPADGLTVARRYFTMLGTSH